VDETDVDQIAWRILHDLCRPGGELATLSPEGLERLIGMRLIHEASRAVVPVESLAEAFNRAMGELTGAGRPSKPVADEEPEPEETIDDL
jgi:hypothetical protein